MVKRGRKTAKVGGTSKVIETLKRDPEKAAMVEHMADLESFDRTEVHGLDKDKWYKRYCHEDSLGLRARQGYTKVDDKDVDCMCPGGNTYWAGEGKDANKAKGGLVLMKMPRELRDAREARKQEIRDQQIANFSDTHQKEMAKEGKGVVKTLDQDDPTIETMKSRA